MIIGEIWKEVVVTCFDAISQYLITGKRKYMRNFGQYSRPGIEARTFRTRNPEGTSTTQTTGKFGPAVSSWSF
jgi:nucleoid DNA-binding protein